jgi:hypothetical protein
MEFYLSIDNSTHYYIFELSLQAIFHLLTLAFFSFFLFQGREDRLLLCLKMSQNEPRIAPATTARMGIRKSMFSGVAEVSRGVGTPGGG